MDIIRDRVQVITKALDGLRYSHRRPVEDIRFCRGDYRLREHFSPDGMEWEPFDANMTWGGKDSHFWFLAELTADEAMEGQQVRAILNTGATDQWNTDNPQILVYRNGELACTMDMNHMEMIVADGYRPGERGLTGAGGPSLPGACENGLTDGHGLRAGEKVSLAFYAYSSGFCGPVPPANFFRLETAVYHPEVAAVYYDMKVLFDAADLLEEDDLERIGTLRMLNECTRILDLRRPGSPEFYASVEEAGRYLAERREPGKLPVTVHSIGHTHIDVAWKWPLRQTRQKAVRSFNTVMNLMDRYPEYRFMSSQPQLYEFVKEEAPELFERIRQRVKEGRWETEGAMWVEPDCNLTSGESLVRQILYGQKFFREEFGSEPCQVLWLPDVFGYSAALPQILVKSGLPYFMTTKINWNEYNQFPHDTFYWRGIDGSRVLTHLISTRDYRKQDAGGKAPVNTTYNGLQNVSQIMGTWQRYQDKDLSRDVLTCYGYGDGGGGPTEEMLETGRRLERGALRTPAVRQTFVKEFFHILERNMEGRRPPTWSGELYLEFHRGTYTSMARNKRYNRKSEFALGEAEFYSVMAGIADGSFAYPSRELDRDWKLLLLNQFHDILPGSSIKEVYEDSASQYEKLLASAAGLTERARGTILKAVKTVGERDAEEQEPGQEEGFATKQGTGQEGGFAAMQEAVKESGLVVWNSLSSTRTGLIRVEREVHADGLLSQPAEDGGFICLAEKVPSRGYRIYGAAGSKETEETAQDAQAAGTAQDAGTAQAAQDAGIARNAQAAQAAQDAGIARNAQAAQDAQDAGVAHDAQAAGTAHVMATKSKKQEEKPEDVIRVIEVDQSGRPKLIETPCYQIAFDGAGRMSRIYDRRERREILKEGEAGNQLLAYEDRPREYDAWNIDASYEEHVWPVDCLEEMSLAENGPVRGSIYARWRFLGSVIEQKIRFYSHTARIDFETHVDWHERQILLKTAFPVDILSDKADYEIQFGNVSRPTHRNTSWDQARFETCGHKWADLSEDGYGVALMNDCKYGYDIHDSVMKLTLIKSGIFPNPEADLGSHEFIYSIFPHQGDFRRGGVIREAYDLNMPLASDLSAGQTPGEASFLAVLEDNVVAETVKQAEDGDGVVIRLYEAWGRRGQVHVELPWAAGREAYECDCMEKELCPVENASGILQFSIKPYEIKTIRIR